MNKNLRTVALCLLGAAVVCGALAQFLPWKSLSFSAGGFSASANENLWTVDASFSGTGSSSEGSHSASYWDSQANDSNGIWLVRSGEIMFTLGLVGAIVGGIFLLTGKRAAGGITNLVGGGLGVLAAILLLVGMDQVINSGSNGGPSLNTTFGAFLGIGMGLLAVTAGILCMIPAASRAGPGGAPAYGAPMASGYGAPAYGSAPMAAPAPGGAMRRLKCPKCANIISVGTGMKPVCNKCGYGA
ncbi:MAG: hypothetical protein V4510_11335 [bacterium]